MKHLIVLIVLANAALGVPFIVTNENGADVRYKADGPTVEVGLPGGTTVYTSASGIVLGLELMRTNIVAGERLNAVMVVSNASQASTTLSWENTELRPTDTKIGNFVVTDANGQSLPRTVPYYYTREGFLGDLRGRVQVPYAFPPGSQKRFGGDVVWGYSLTNAGTYLVKAVAHQPVQAETPWVAITVTARPADSPPPGDLYPEVAQLSPERLAELEREEARYRAFAVKRSAEGRRPEAVAASDTMPDGLRERIAASVTADADGAASLPATVPWYRGKLAYGFGVLALGTVIGLVAWRSRRKEPHV